MLMGALSYASENTTGFTLILALVVGGAGRSLAGAIWGARAIKLLAEAVMNV